MINDNDKLIKDGPVKDAELEEFLKRKIQYHGVAGISINLKGELILIDPWFKINEEIAKSIGKVNKKIYIYISHGHFDHFEYVHQIVKNLHNKYKIKIILPGNVYRRHRKIKRDNVDIIIPELPSEDKLGYHKFKAIKGEHVVKESKLKYYLPKLKKLRACREALKHLFIYPGKEMINYVFKIQPDGITIGHIGSANITPNLVEYMKDLDILFLAKANHISTDIYHIEELSPRICVPIHHINGHELGTNKDIGELVKREFTNTKMREIKLSPYANQY